MWFGEGAFTDFAIEEYDPAFAGKEGRRDLRERPGQVCGGGVQRPAGQRDGNRSGVEDFDPGFRVACVVAKCARDGGELVEEDGRELGQGTGSVVGCARGQPRNASSDDVELGSEDDVGAAKVVLVDLDGEDVRAWAQQVGREGGGADDHGVTDADVCEGRGADNGAGVEVEPGEFGSVQEEDGAIVDDVGEREGRAVGSVGQDEGRPEEVARLTQRKEGALGCREVGALVVEETGADLPPAVIECDAGPVGCRRARVEVTPGSGVDDGLARSGEGTDSGPVAWPRVVVEGINQLEGDAARGRLVGPGGGGGEQHAVEDFPAGCDQSQVIAIGADAASPRPDDGKVVAVGGAESRRARGNADDPARGEDRGIGESELEPASGELDATEVPGGDSGGVEQFDVGAADDGGTVHDLGDEHLEARNHLDAEHGRGGLRRELIVGDTDVQGQVGGAGVDGQAPGDQARAGVDRGSGRGDAVDRVEERLGW